MRKNYLHNQTSSENFSNVSTHRRTAQRSNSKIFEYKFHIPDASLNPYAHK